MSAGSLSILIVYLRIFTYIYVNDHGVDNGKFNTYGRAALATEGDG